MREMERAYKEIDAKNERKTENERKEEYEWKCN